MLTYTGVVLLPGNYSVPRPMDMAVQLGRIARWCGATSVFWSVLHHIRLGCVIVDQDVVVPGLGPDMARAIRPWWLLHDVDEVATSDIPAMWKVLAPDLRAAADVARDRAALRYIGSLPGAEERAAIKALDRFALAVEAHYIGPKGSLDQTGLSTEFTMMQITDARYAWDAMTRYTPDTSIWPDGELVQWFLLSLGVTATEQAKLLFA